jgi:hypothetical protein
LRFGSDLKPTLQVAEAIGLKAQLFEASALMNTKKP